MRTKIGARGTEINTDAVPTKYPPNDLDWVDLLKKRTGLSRSEIIRRSVRLLATEAAKNPKWNWVEQTARPMDPLPAELKKELGEDDTAAAFEEANARARAASDADRKRSPRRARS